MHDLIAYVTEDCDVDERGPMASGLFSCFVDRRAEEPPPAEIAGQGAEGLSLAEAVRWGRARADRVAVRIACEGCYSAGRVALPEPPLDESRQLCRRRPNGWEFLDRADADPPISWDVILEVDTRSAGRVATAGARTALGELWRTSLHRPPACRVVEMTLTGADGRISPLGTDGWTMVETTPAAVLRVVAGGYHGAIGATLTAAKEAAAAARWEPAPEFTVGGAFATASQAARRNAHIDANGLVF
jgi:hypothetical protein